LPEKFIQILRKFSTRIRWITFMHEKFILLEGVYEPREDSFLLALNALKLELNKKKVLELGVGSGVISVLCAKRNANVTAIDISEKAVINTIINAHLHNVKVNVKLGNLFTPVFGERFDIILANLPYLPKLSEIHDDAIFAGQKGNETIIRSLYFLPFHLKHSGRALYVFSSESRLQEILNTAKKIGLIPILRDTLEFYDENLLCYEFRLSFRSLTCIDKLIYKLI